MWFISLSLPFSNLRCKCPKKEKEKKHHVQDLLTHLTSYGLGNLWEDGGYEHNPF
jgi:hypothetical protein